MPFQTNCPLIPPQILLKYESKTEPDALHKLLLIFVEILIFSSSSIHFIKTILACFNQELFLKQRAIII